MRTRTRRPLAVLLLLPLLFGAGLESAPDGLELVSVDEATAPCLDTLEPGDGELFWPACFDDPGKATALRKRLRREGIPAWIEKVGRWEQVVRYAPLSVDEARSHGARALEKRPEAPLGMLDVSVDWEPELRSFVWDLEATCPDGWTELGAFKLTAYVLAQEQHADGPLVDAPCGLDGQYREDFLFGDGVKLQGSGLTVDGRIVHWAGDDCFEETRCVRTATRACATPDRTVAVDPDVIPLGSELLIEGVGLRLAEDVGGRIRGQHIDVYYGTELTVDRANARTRHDQLVCIKAPAQDPGSTN